MTTKRFIINGKFLRANMTGVHRVALELTNALADLAHEDHPAVRGLDFVLWHTRDGRSGSEKVRMRTQEIGPLDGIAWEQITLPLRSGSDTLINFCNVGPAFARKSLTMIHDVQVYESPRSYPVSFRLWYRALQPLIARNNIALLTVSEFSRQSIARVGLARLDRIFTVHNGIDHILREPSYPGTLDRLMLQPLSYVLALGTVQSHKNISVLLQAFSREELQPYTLVLFGSATKDDFVGAGHSVPDNVRFLGHVSDGELRALMEQALALAFPSRTEGFGLPPLEALRLGCPVVVSPRGALLEVCGEGALYADPDKPEEWASQIAALRNEQVRQTKIAEGLARSEQFTWRRSALALADHLRTIGH